MKLLTSEQMRNIDKTAIEKLGVPGTVLMENAGVKLFEIIHEELHHAKNPRIAIICGKGNNGGDGFVLARHLLNNKISTDVFLLGNSNEVKGDAKINLDILLKSGHKIIEITNEKKIPSLKTYDLLVDAIFGTGFTGKITGIAEKIITNMNNSDIPIFSVDVPSGLNANYGSVQGVCVKASFTATMCLPKRGLVLYPGKDYTGDVYIIDIGVPPELFTDIDTNIIEPDDIKKILPVRSDNSNKGSFGKVFILAGSKGMTGAPALTSLSALKMGAGLVRLGIPESLNDIVKYLAKEVITVSLPDTSEGKLSIKAKDKILKEISNATVVVIGPGLSVSKEIKELLQSILPKIRVPLIIDADGLNNLFLSDIKKLTCPVIITPHPGELSRLINLPISDIQAKRIDIVSTVVQDSNITLVLKGAPTVIAYKKETYLNPVYNSALAKAGTGDVLTGIIAGLLAQKLSPVNAAKVGVWVHANAAEIMSKKSTKYSVLASDIIKAIPLAIKNIIK
ncbi:MAG: NAD(P)H-hydrate dehydratase [bacterium]|nr:NAD(P)H-hydrate dehydratase [bacterium]